MAYHHDRKNTDAPFFVIPAAAKQSGGSVLLCGGKAGIQRLPDPGLRRGDNVIRHELSERGYSLVELITSLVIITILALGLTATTSYSKQTELRNRERVQAAAILEKAVMEARQAGVAGLVPGTTTRSTTRDHDGIDGVLTTQIISDTDNVQDKLLRVRFDWEHGAKSESAVTFLFQE